MKSGDEELAVELSRQPGEIRAVSAIQATSRNAWMTTTICRLYITERVCRSWMKSGDEELAVELSRLPEGDQRSQRYPGHLPYCRA